MKMIVEKYNPNWVEQFCELKEFLEKNTTEYISIEHVGSTSIPGMNAKPIIDIDVVVEDAAQFLKLKEELEKIGYIHEGDRGISGREAFDNENVPVSIDHHLYVCVKDNAELMRHLKFRDKLRSSPELVNEYNKIKEEILAKVGVDNRSGYVQMKQEEYKWFFDKVIEGKSDSFENHPKDNLPKKFSTKKTVLIIFVAFSLYVIGALVSYIFMDLLSKVVVIENKYVRLILQHISDFGFVFLLLWPCIYKMFHLKFEDFGINLHFKWWSFVAAILIPAYMVVVYLIVGNLVINEHSPIETILVILNSLALGLQSGFLEEILFRGIFMKSLENRWNKTVAIIAPSFFFSLVHIPNMPSFSVTGILVLIVAGTMVGVMFSMAAYKGNSIANSAIIHAVWNFTLSSVFDIVPEGSAAANSIFTITLPTKNIFITGGEFGIEASMFAIIAYVVVSRILMPKKMAFKE